MNLIKFLKKTILLFLFFIPALAWGSAWWLCSTENTYDETKDVKLIGWKQDVSGILVGRLGYTDFYKGINNTHQVILNSNHFELSFFQVFLGNYKVKNNRVSSGTLHNGFYHYQFDRNKKILSSYYFDLGPIVGSREKTNQTKGSNHLHRTQLAKKLLERPFRQQAKQWKFCKKDPWWKNQWRFFRGIFYM